MTNKRVDYEQEAKNRIDWLNKHLGKEFFKVQQIASDSYNIVYAENMISKADNYTFRKNFGFKDSLSGKELLTTASAMYSIIRFLNRLNMSPEQFREVDQ